MVIYDSWIHKYILYTYFWDLDDALLSRCLWGDPNGMHVWLVFEVLYSFMFFCQKEGLDKFSYRSIRGLS